MLLILFCLQIFVIKKRECLKPANFGHKIFTEGKISTFNLLALTSTD